MTLNSKQLDLTLIKKLFYRIIVGETAIFTN